MPRYVKYPRCCLGGEFTFCVTRQVCRVVGSHDCLDFSQKSRFRENGSNKEATHRGWPFWFLVQVQLDVIRPALTVGLRSVSGDKTTRVQVVQSSVFVTQPFQQGLVKCFRHDGFGNEVVHACGETLILVFGKGVCC